MLHGRERLGGGSRGLHAQGRGGSGGEAATGDMSGGGGRRRLSLGGWVGVGVLELLQVSRGVGWRGAAGQGGLGYRSYS